MIYRVVQLKAEERRKGRRDLLKAAGIAAGTLAVIEALIFLSTKLGM